MPKEGRTPETIEFDRKLGKKLQNIRQNYTDDNQEDFYEKYLWELHAANLASRSSYQGYMSKLENGETSCPPQLLPVYARIVGCTIAELLDTTEFIADSPAKLAPETVCRFIHRLHEEYNAEIIEINKSYEMGKTGYALFFDDEWHGLPSYVSYEFIMDYLKGMHGIYKNEFLDSNQQLILSENIIQKIFAKQEAENLPFK